MQKHRIHTNIGRDQKITVELKQDFDLLEVLSLKFSQKDIFSSGNCSEYGVVVGRVSVNNGLGIPNTKVSIFIPLDDVDENDPVISKLYPYKEITDKDDTGHRYNLLPYKKQHGGHQPTGTFFDQEDIITREEFLEVFEKYYKYTVKTNDAGDFMIWGVPVGIQTIHVDVDLSDISCFSLRPNDFIRKGFGVDDFKNQYAYKSSNDIDSLPQIKSFNRSIEVYPFWGAEDICEIGITRTDFDLSEQGVKIEPKAYLLGSTYSDQGKNAVNKNCVPHGDMGKKCSLVTGPSTIEIIRFSPERDDFNRPILETFDLQEDIEEDGSFVLPLPMNMDYLYTNEYGENEITNDPNKGVPTSACYRFRISEKNNELSRVRTTANYLIPNIREYNTNSYEIDKSYAWSLNWDDYPTEATIFNTDPTENIIFKTENQAYYPEDYFYRFNYNKVYGISSFMGSYFSGEGISRHTFLGIKDISPKDEDDCENNVVTPPVNWGIQKFNFSILLAIIINTLERIMYKVFIAAIQVIIFPFQWLIGLKIPIIGHVFRFFDKAVVEPLQVFGTINLGIVIYPECETCDNPEDNEVTSQGVSDPEINYESAFSDPLYIPLEPDLVTVKNSVTNWFFPLSMFDSLYEYYNGSVLCYIKFYDRSTNIAIGFSTLVLDKTTDSNGVEWYYYSDTIEVIKQPYPLIECKIFRTDHVISQDYNTTNVSPLELTPEGCSSYTGVYDDQIKMGTYYVTDNTLTYENLKSTDITWLPASPPSNKFSVADVIGNVRGNQCDSCSTHSGYSEFRYGKFTIIPAASTTNGNGKANLHAINEYSRRKLIGKLFCEGISNYSFLDNWLTGSLYFFPFKEKVRWNNEETLDLDFRRTRYCDSLVYFKISDKRFYYRSSVTTDGFNFENVKHKSLGHPTTIVDLGPRDEFIKEICIDPSLDPNSSVIRNIGSTSFQSFKEMMGLYINYKMDTFKPESGISLKRGITYRDFFSNGGFDSQTPNKMDNRVLNGDILQLISINNETGIEEFDLQNKNYTAYQPQILDPDNNPILFSGNTEQFGPMPINLVLDSGEGLRVRRSLNEPGRLTESSQLVPFYLWEKNGLGFGTGVNQAWDYDTNKIEVQPLQGMKNPDRYKYISGGTEPYDYVLFPMTKNYTGQTIDIGYTGSSVNEIIINVESSVDNHNDFDNEPEGFTYLYYTPSGPISGATAGTLYTRIADTGTTWATQPWTPSIDFIIKPTKINYLGTKQILSTPFLFYFGLRPGKTAVDKFIKLFGPKGSFPPPIN
jgi:hypothetical protein